MDVWKIARYCIGFAIAFALLFVGLGIYEIGESAYVAATAPSRPGEFRFYHTVRTATRSRDSSGRTYTSYSEEYRPVYHYLDAGGTTVEVEDDHGHVLRWYDPGQAISVLVPEDPDLAPRIDGFVALYVPGIVSVLVGGLFAGFFTLVWRFVGRLEGGGPSTTGRPEGGRPAVAALLHRVAGRMAEVNRGSARAQREGDDSTSARLPERERTRGAAKPVPVSPASGSTVRRGRGAPLLVLALLVVPPLAAVGLWVAGAFDDAGGEHMAATAEPTTPAASRPPNRATDLAAGAGTDGGSPADVDTTSGQPDAPGQTAKVTAAPAASRASVETPLPQASREGPAQPRSVPAETAGSAPASSPADAAGKPPGSTVQPDPGEATGAAPMPDARTRRAGTAPADPPPAAAGSRGDVAGVGVPARRELPAAEVNKVASFYGPDELAELAAKGYPLARVRPSVVKSLVGKGDADSVAKLRLLFEAGFDLSQVYARRTFGDQAVSRGKADVVRLIREHGGRFEAPPEYVALVLDDEPALAAALDAAPAERRWRGQTIDAFAKRLRKTDLLDRARSR